MFRHTSCTKDKNMLTTCVFLKDAADLKHRETIRVFSEHHITDTAHKACFISDLPCFGFVRQ